jgi:protein-tyrosine phosphatase
MTVCTGNICRSPMAAVVFSAALARDHLAAHVDSAGVSDEEFGHPIDPRARRVLEDRGYHVPPHRAHRITDAELRDADLVLAMTYSHYRALVRRAERAGVDPRTIRLVREFDEGFAGEPRGSALDIDDPWYGGEEDFELALAQIEDATPGVVGWVRDHQAAPTPPA